MPDTSSKPTRYESLIYWRGVLLTVAVTTLYAFLDFTLPGEITVAILYSSSVVVAGWTRSTRFLWFTTFVCVALTYAGLDFGPQPPKPLLSAFYVNRSFVAFGLLVVAVLVHWRIRQHGVLRRAQYALHRANEELENRVTSEVSRRIEVEQSLYQSQKMEAIGQLAGGIAHDFNNILTSMVGNLEMIRARCPEDDPRSRFAENALLGAKQGTSPTRQLLGFARRQTTHPGVIEVERALGEALKLARPVMPEKIQLSAEVDPGVWQVNVDHAQFESALLNLIINARDAMPHGGLIKLVAHNMAITQSETDLPHGNYVRISVSDSGCGMSPETIARAFEPLFTTKPLGKGTGLGLSMVLSFAKQCGGTAKIESELGHGTTVHVYVPQCRPAQ